MFGVHVDEAIKKHALAEYPNECCGLVLGGGIYVRLRNVHEDPLNAFRMDNTQLLAHLNSGKIRAIVHSHTNNDPYPSKVDMQGQLDSRLPWGIVTVYKDKRVDTPFWFGDSVPIPEYIGRSFRHGVTDCYALFRDINRQENNLLLNVYPRQFLWWEQGENMLSDFYAEEGFVEVSPRDMQKYDGLLFAIRSDKIVNHIGIYMGNGLMYHHLINRLSVRDPVERWSKYIIKVIRHKSRIQS